ncbi:hypothetical protein [Inquilinus sp. CA228]|uniref:hypothetical protein n=1 Tax=Inquilinus sp. CA228 TaxID=3455609 RepID=UPI003F8D1E84
MASNVTELLVTTPFYSPIELGDTGEPIFEQLVFGSIVIDCHCTECGKDSTFRRDSLASNGGGAGSGVVTVAVAKQTIKIIEGNTINIELYCARNHAHKMRYWFTVQKGKLIKIGQYPSMVSISRGGLRKYSKVIYDGGIRELESAMTLATHDHGIGAVVYLRRIIEHLLNNHAKLARENGTFDADIERLDIPQRIEALRDTLPRFLYENKTIYGILSKGVHELSDETCMQYFPMLLSSILLILEQELSERQRILKEDVLRKEIHKLSSALGSSKTD